MLSNRADYGTGFDMFITSVDAGDKGVLTVGVVLVFNTASVKLTHYT